MAAWQSYGKNPPALPDADRYSLLWSWYAGSWSNDPRISLQSASHPDLYRNTRQVWRQASAIVNLYDQFVYEGDLSTDGKPLPDGSRGAIPIDPQMPNQSDKGQLIRAFHELFNMWYWQQQMSLRPKLCAALGDCLTVIVDDFQHGIVYPQTYWPGWVPDADLELDSLGNVKRYAIEYPVSVQASTAFGQDIKAESYLFRQEVDGENLRFYKDGKLHEYADIGPSVQPNPYGFVPAIWDRHDSVPWSNRGISALERTLQQTMELNSVLSHALDYQRKQFSAPIGVKGSAVTARAGRTVSLPGGVSVTFPSGSEPQPDDLIEARRQAAEQIHLIGMDATGEFVTVKFDIGQTTEMLNLVMDSILAESPEARYGQEILKMSQVTGPGMERVLAPIVGLIKSARKMHDPQTVKLLQMATAMMGYRLNNGNIPDAIVRSRSARFEAFRPFDLTSFGKGLLDCTIPGRDVFPETPLEKAQRLLIVQNITDPYLMTQAGVPEEEVKKMAAERQAQADLEASMLTGLAVAQGQNDNQDGNVAA